MNYTKKNNITQEEIKWFDENRLKFKRYRNSKVFIRLADILRYRLMEKSFEEIGKVYSVTGTRVRQMEAKAIEIIIGRRISDGTNAI